MSGLSPYQFGLRVSSAMSFFAYFVIMNGPPLTKGCPFSGSFANVLSPLPSPVAYCCHTCGGRIGVKPRSNSEVPDGFSYFATTVCASVAVIDFRNFTLPAQLPVGPFAYFRIVLNVQATSVASSGWPSDHFAPSMMWNVVVRPSGACCHLSARLPM